MKNLGKIIKCASIGFRFTMRDGETRPRPEAIIGLIYYKLYSIPQFPVTIALALNSSRARSEDNKIKIVAWLSNGKR